MDGKKCGVSNFKRDRYVLILIVDNVSASNFLGETPAVSSLAGLFWLVTISHHVCVTNSSLFFSLNVFGIELLFFFANRSVFLRGKMRRHNKLCVCFFFKLTGAEILQYQ